MGKTFNGFNDGLWMDRDARRGNARASRESWMVRGEGVKAVDPSTGLTLSTPRTEGGAK